MTGIMSSVPQIQTYQSTNALAGSLLALGVLSVALRVYARYMQKSALRADDYLMLVSILSFAGSCGAVIYGTTHKVIGYPEHTPGATSLESYAKTVIAFDMMSEACMGLIKLSALLLYRRIFCVAGHRDWFGRVVDIWIMLTSLWTVAFFISSPFICGSRFSSLWVASNAKEHSDIGYGWLLGQSSIDLFFEVTIPLLPLPKIWTLHTTLRRRMAISLFFLAALVSLGASIARLVIFVQTSQAEGAGGMADTYLSNTELMWMVVFENGTSLLAVNLPVIWFFRSKISSPKDILNSFRSVLSLSSQRSNAPRERQKLHNVTAASCPDSADSSLSDTEANELGVVGCGGSKANLEFF